MDKVKRLSATPKALKLVKKLEKEFGELMFYQAGGCCKGTQPQCLRKGHFFPRTKDVRIGKILDYDFWIDHNLFEYWKNAHFELDVLDGFGTGGFSLEIPKGKTFKINYRLFTADELKNLEDTMLYHEFMQQEKDRKQTI